MKEERKDLDIFTKVRRTGLDDVVPFSKVRRTCHYGLFKHTGVENLCQSFKPIHQARTGAADEVVVDGEYLV